MRFKGEVCARERVCAALVASCARRRGAQFYAMPTSLQPTRARARARQEVCERVVATQPADAEPSARAALSSGPRHALVPQICGAAPARARIAELFNHSGRRLSGLREAAYSAASSTRWATTRSTCAWSSPPRPYNLIVDTGSSVTALPCASCTQCGTHVCGQRGRFDTQQSKTARYVGCSTPGVRCAPCSGSKCMYSVHYTEGSAISGHVVEDVVQLRTRAITSGDPSTPPNRTAAVKSFFGCQTKETGMFYRQQADGILGVQRSSTGHMPTLLTSLVAAEKAPNSFSLCLTDTSGLFLMGGSLSAERKAELARTRGAITVPLCRRLARRVHRAPLGDQPVHRRAVLRPRRERQAICAPLPAGRRRGDDGELLVPIAVVVHAAADRAPSDDHRLGHHLCLRVDPSVEGDRRGGEEGPHHRRAELAAGVGAGRQGVPPAHRRRAQQAAEAAVCARRRHDQGGRPDPHAEHDEEAAADQAAAVHGVVPAQGRRRRIGVYDNQHGGTVIGASIMREREVVFDLQARSGRGEVTFVDKCAELRAGSAAMQGGYALAGCPAVPKRRLSSFIGRRAQSHSPRNISAARRRRCGRSCGAPSADERAEVG